MNRLEEIKEKYAKHYAFNSWGELCQSVDSASQLNEAVRDIATMYAKECIKASLEKASENVSMKLKQNIDELSMMDDWSEIDKDLITNTGNIVLL